jgi:hypothetical protein
LVVNGSCAEFKIISCQDGQAKTELAWPLIWTALVVHEVKMTSDRGLDQRGVEAAADHFHAVGLQHGRWPKPPKLPASWRELDSIGERIRWYR